MSKYYSALPVTFFGATFDQQNLDLSNKVFILLTTGYNQACHVLVSANKLKSAQLQHLKSLR